MLLFSIIGTNNYGRSLARTGSFFDSDAGSNWSLVEISTPGGFNDVTNSTDRDRDGLPDANETPGSTFAGLPLYQWGARTNTRDIFIHVDYMPSRGAYPEREALDLVVKAFSNQGIHIHFDVGDLFDRAPGVSPQNHDLSDDLHEVSFSEVVSLNRGSANSSIYDYKRDMPLARKQVFHYALFANSQGEAGSLGRAEILGNDLMITLGGFVNTVNRSPRHLINIQASTLMHELGHNLGLLHGGKENQKHKPNYYSVMNYAYSLTGLPLAGGAVEERYFVNRGLTNLISLTDGPLSNSFRIDYSHGLSIELDENSLDESLGIGQFGAVDWNTNGQIDTSNISVNLNPEENTSLSLLSDYDDWANLQFAFYRFLTGDRELRLPDFIPPLQTHSHPVMSEWEDRQQEWLEPCGY